MLMFAYDRIKDCTCQLEGKDGCYHCILTYGNQYSRDSFSREQAEILFGKLVGGSKSWERIEGSVGTEICSCIADSGQEQKLDFRESA